MNKLKNNSDKCQTAYYKALNEFRVALIKEQKTLEVEVARLDNLGNLSSEQEDQHDEMTSRLVTIFAQLESLYY